MRGRTFREIEAILKDREAKHLIPSCLPNDGSAKECILLRDHIFRFDDCSKSGCHDGGIRYPTVKKHVHNPSIPQTQAEVTQLWSSKFNASCFTLNDNYYYKELSKDNYFPLLKETYDEAKETGVVAFNHWNITKGNIKYGIYEYDFASDCPGDYYSGFF